MQDYDTNIVSLRSARADDAPTDILPALGLIDGVKYVCSLAAETGRNHQLKRAQCPFLSADFRQTLQVRDGNGSSSFVRPITQLTHYPHDP